YCQGWQVCRQRRTTAWMQEVEQRRSSCRRIARDGKYADNAGAQLSAYCQGWQVCRQRRTTAWMQEVEQRRSSCRAVFANCDEKSGVGSAGADVAVQHDRL